MNEIEIQRHSFELAKNRLKKFSEKKDTELKIENVKTDGGFLGLGSHKVTGSELNSRLETIQEHFISVYTTNNKVIKEFREVYNALDALDKDYITSIIANVKAIEKTSNDVRKQQNILKQHNKKLEEQQQKLDMHQAEIEKNVENISTIVNILKDFKERLEEHKHLTDIDKIWNEVKENTEKLNELAQTDEKMSESIDSNVHDINILKEYKDSLSGVSHLYDVDVIWKDVDEHKSRLIECKKRDEDIVDTIQKNKEEVDENIANAVHTSNAAIETLTKKIKYAYWIAGGSAGLAIIELILLFMKVI